jgi:HAD superfamily hydrolase (TIGR01459 family)
MSALIDPARLSPQATGWTSAHAFDAYEAMRPILPSARTGGRVPRSVPNLEAVFDQFDAFVLDAFGVLNIGNSPIPGAVERVAQMQAAGRAVLVLTNGASYPRAHALAKYRRLGFAFAESQVVASRDVAAHAMAAMPDVRLWAAIGPAGSGFDDLPGHVELLDDDMGLLEKAQGFLFLGSEGWTDARQAALGCALATQPRPLLVANPDLVAPRETGLTLEPGFFALRLLEQLGTALSPDARAVIGPHWFGKPHRNAFEAVRARLPQGIAPLRVAMVGDTLHTDILGGQAAGFSTVLIAGHGLFAGHDPAPFIAKSGICPDFIAATT